MPLNGKLQQQFAAPQEQPQEKVDPNAVLEAIAQFNKHGKALRRNQSLQDVALRLAEIADLAEQSVLGEADDWFDSHTLKRNMKEIKGYSGEFQKLAKEADLMEQRMVALYDDMGRILERYFEIPEELEPEPVSQIGSAPSVSMGAQVVQDKVPLQERPVQEDVSASTLHTAPMVGPAVPPVGKVAVKKGNSNDQLTLRAIQAVHEKLKKTNPEYAVRFAKLPPTKMKQVVWKLVE